MLLDFLAADNCTRPIPGGVPIFFVKALGLLKVAELTPSRGDRLVVRDLRLIRRARAEHGQDDVRSAGARGR